VRVLMLGRQPYVAVEQAMRDFTAARGAGSEDELWLVEHEAVFTQGLAGREQHVRDSGDIPVLRTSRGGQVTYHGPGQVVAYPLVDLRRLGIYVKEYVYRLEEAVIQCLAHWGVSGHRVRTAPGVYVRLVDPGSHATLAPTQPGEDAFAGLGKIAALGIKVSQQRSFHGLALNVDMDLAPFARIDPCGYATLQATDVRRCGAAVSWADAAEVLAHQLTQRLRA
jgi:lipoyl(octanoyl) transferase